ncbi:MAG: hypothetical protein WAW37_18280 [Syntrophobacteraceae bacterium]
MVEAGLSRTQVASRKNPGKVAEVARSLAQVAPKKKKSLGKVAEAEVNLVQVAPNNNPAKSI